MLLVILAAAFVSHGKRTTAGSSPEHANDARPSSAHVMKAVDGDTLLVAVDDERVKVRVIGINTPETVDPRRAVQCFGREASAEAHRLLDGSAVTLTADATQDDVDKYGRSLRYVTLPDGSDYGHHMIAQGYAHEYTYETAYAKQADYRSAEHEARKAKLGLWANDTCAGDTTKPAVP